jgi:hypothetical protein
MSVTTMQVRSNTCQISVHCTMHATVRLRAWVHAWYSARRCTGTVALVSVVSPTIPTRAMI